MVQEAVERSDAKCRSQKLLVGVDSLRTLISTTSDRTMDTIILVVIIGGGQPGCTVPSTSLPTEDSAPGQNPTRRPAITHKIANYPNCTWRVSGSELLDWMRR